LFILNIGRGFIGGLKLKIVLITK
jgi:hypothetical protein